MNELTYDEIIKACSDKTKNRIYCKTCGHSLNISKERGKRICTHCGNYVFREAKEEFKYKLLNCKKGNI